MRRSPMKKQALYHSHPSGPGFVCCLCGKSDPSPGERLGNAWSTVTPCYENTSRQTRGSLPTHYTCGEGRSLKTVAEQLTDAANNYAADDLKCHSSCRLKFGRTLADTLFNDKRPTNIQDASSQPSSSPPQCTKLNIPVASPVISRGAYQLLRKQVSVLCAVNH